MIQQGRARLSGYAPVDDEWYTETPECVDKFLAAEPLEGVTWDPACGGGNIPRRITAYGMDSLGSDMCDRADGQFVVADFMTVLPPLRRPTNNIVTNPPFSLAVDFVRRGLDLVPGKVVVLQRLAWLEGKERGKFFAEAPLHHVWIHSGRQSMPPGGTNIKPAGGKMAYAWFVFRRPGHVGPPTLGFLP